MIFLDSIRFSFLITSVFVVVLLSLLSVYMYKKDTAFKFYVLWPIIIGIVTILDYTIFLMMADHNLAVLFDSIFFIGTDWLALCMFMFTTSYTGILKKYKKKLLLVFVSLCGIDTFSLLINNFTFHSFDLVYMTSSFGIGYWGNNFTPLHYVHLGMDYVMVLLTFLELLISTIKAPVVCKIKYVSILIAYAVVIFVNCFCYSINLPVDVSVILYGVLAGFFCYYSTYTYPHKMLSLSLQSVNDTVSDAVMYFNSNDKCIYYNKAAQDLFEIDENFEPFLAEAYRDRWEAQLKPSDTKILIEDSFKIRGREHHFKVEFRREFFNEIRIGSYLKLIDITEDMVSFRKDKYVATHDAFTGILNRTGFLEAVDELIEEKGTFGYVMLTSNIRDFKIINEMFGEDVGDAVIQKQAGILKTFSHPNTIYGRICDDKFAVYTKRENFNEKEFIGYMNLMQKVMNRPLYQMRVVVGVYYSQGMIESAQSMYDKALLAATQIVGKYNEIFAYYNNELMDKLLYQKQIAADFVDALENNEFVLNLQPIMNADKKYKGAEVLSRWNHPLKGLLLPEDFLSILEKTGLIYQLDLFVWEEAAKLLKKWREQGITDHYLSVNISVKDFFYTDVCKVFTRLVDTYDILPSNFHIEITESVLMSDFAKAFSLANKLQKEGFCVTIDNFGHGCSSLNMLKDLCANELKIGINLLQSSVQTDRNTIILGAIIDMANSLGMEVVAEGVENQEQYELLKKCNCTKFQGYYLNEPLSIEDYEKGLFTLKA